MDDNKLKDSIKSAVDNDKTDYFEGMSEFKPSPENFYHKQDGANANKANSTKKRYRYSMFAVAACLILVFVLVLNGNVLSPIPGSDSSGTAIAPGGSDSPVYDFDADERKVKKIEMISVDSDYKNLAEEIDRTYGEVSRTMFSMNQDDMLISGGMAEGDFDTDSDPAYAGAPAGGAAEAPMADAPAPGEAPAMESDSGGGMVEESEMSALMDGTAEYSETNIQVEGVDEADIIKTDGEYIYVLNSKNICIVEAKDGDPELISKIAQDTSDINSNKYCEIYISGDRLVAIKQGFGGTVKYSDGATKNETVADIFDISDRSNPVKMQGFGQSGYYSDSRLIGNTLYLISTYAELYHQLYDTGEIEPRSVAPVITEGDEATVCLPEDISIMPETEFPAYTLIRSIDVENAKGIANESLLGDAGEVYCSNNNIYITSYKYNNEESPVAGGKMYVSSSETIVSKYSIDKGEIDHVASSSIPGSILNQFSMDEYDENFRVVTNEYESYWIERSNPSNKPMPYDESDYGEKIYNSLYVLDKNMELIGSVEELAPEENIFSCRFMGDVAYFVTFKQVDPLFSVDLSDPTNPKVVGVLKIPGFSEYLHPYDDGLLFGLGRDADENTGMTKGLKLTMFDNSDPTDVTEKDTFILGDEYFSPAESNHKAILINKSKKIIAFPTENSYKIMTYDDATGFEMILDIVLDQTNQDPYYAYKEIRGLFIGDVFYVISPNTIKTYDMANDFELMHTAAIDEGASSIFGDGIIMPLGMSMVDGVTLESSVDEDVLAPGEGDFWEE